MKFIKKNYIYILSFLIPCLILSIVYIEMDCFFFQTKSVLVGDAKEQYISLLSYFKDVLIGNQSLIYSFGKGFGGGMIGTYAYYLASPINWLIVFCSKTSIENFFLFSILFRCGLSGLTMYHYLNKNKFSVVLSTCYALCGYLVNYCFNIMWLDALWILPLIMLGIDKIVSRKKESLYFITLFFAIFSNFYIGYMICIFSVIYFIYKLVVTYDRHDWKLIKKIIFRFSFVSLLSGLLCSFLLFPTLMELKTSGGVSNINQHFNFLSPVTLLSKLFVGTNVMVDAFSNDNLHIYCGLIVFVLVYFYFISNNISKKEKIATSIILLILLLSAIIPYLNYIWHGFKFPNGYGYRFSFLIVAFLIMIASKVLNYLKEFNFKHYLIIFILSIAFLCIALFTNTRISLFEVIISSLILFLILLFLWIVNHSKKFYNLFSIMLISIVFLELFLNTFLSYDAYFKDDKNNWNLSYENYNNVLSKYNSSNVFHRLNFDNKYNSLNSLLFNYHSLSVFLSTEQSDVIEFSKKIGLYTRRINYNYESSSSVIIDSLLGMKYIFSDKGINKKYDIIDSYLDGDKNIKVYDNINNLSLGYMINNNEEVFGSDSFIYQNNLLNSMIDGNYEFYNKINFSKYDDKYIIDVKDDEVIYLVFETLDDDFVSIKVNNEEIHNDKVYSRYNTSFILKSGRNEIDIINNNGKIKNVLFYTINEEMVNKALNYLSKNQLSIDEFRNGYLCGEIMVDDTKKTLFLSIPYDKNWRVVIDDEEYEYFKIYDTFIGINLIEGNHKVELIYVNNELMYGSLVSIISLVATCVYFVVRKRGFL